MLHKWVVYSIKPILYSSALVLLLVLANRILSNKLAEYVQVKLSEMNASVTNVQVSIISRSVTLNELSMEKGVSDFPVYCDMKRVTISGFSVFQILFGEPVLIRKIVLANGSVTYDSSEIGSSKEAKLRFPLSVESIELDNVRLQYKMDSVFKFSGEANLTMSSIKIDGPLSIYDFAAIKDQLRGSVSNIKWFESTGFYTITAGSIHFHDKGSVEIDSFRVKPNYSKLDFAHIKRKQVTRIDLYVPKLKISHFDYRTELKMIALSRLSVIDAQLHAFRDKRLPFLKKEIVPLPMQSLGRLPFKFIIDSILVEGSSIVVEEIAEQASKSGFVEFNNVGAVFTDLSNDTSSKSMPALNAHGTFMKTGSIEAKFTFPIDTSIESTVSGKISNLPLKEVNTMSNAAEAFEFESGVLNSLYFNFYYNDYVSKGEIQLNYTDLKIASFDPDNKRSKQILKSAFVNFLLKDTKDRRTPVKNRKGLIAEERHRKKFVFNFWWKSLLSGIKNSILAPPARKELKN